MKSLISYLRWSGFGRYPHRYKGETGWGTLFAIRGSGLGQLDMEVFG